MGASCLQPPPAPIRPTINLSYTQTGLLGGKKALVHIKKKDLKPCVLIPIWGMKVYIK